MYYKSLEEALYTKKVITEPWGSFINLIVSVGDLEAEFCLCKSCSGCWLKNIQYPYSSERKLILEIIVWGAFIITSFFFLKACHHFRFLSYFNLIPSIHASLDWYQLMKGYVGPVMLVIVVKAWNSQSTTRLHVCQPVLPQSTSASITLGHLVKPD